MAASLGSNVGIYNPNKDPPKKTGTRRATIDIFNIKSISSCAKDDN